MFVESINMHNKYNELLYRTLYKVLLRTITEEGRLYLIENKRKDFNGKSTTWIEIEKWVDLK